MTLGLPRLHHRVCESTNDLAKRLAEHGATHGTTVTADMQTAGRGRQGRTWVAPARSALLMSVIVRPVGDTHKLAPLAAGLAVAETCESLTPRKAELKWPNDVWIDGRKVAGILVEARPDTVPERSWLVIGIGLNTRVSPSDLPEEFRDAATGLDLAPGSDALGPLLTSLDRWLSTEAAEVVDAWRARDALHGRRIAWSGGAGTAAGIDHAGNLVVSLDDGTTETLAAGEVHLQVRSS